MTIANEWQVLVVEDEYDSIQMVSKILQHYGAKVHVAHDGRECITMLQSMIPTIIIMDLALPEMDGWETLKKIRADEHTVHIPVAAITAYQSVNVEEDAHDDGFDAYFPKPLNTTKIINSLSALINKHDE
ncbi:MAG: response regulator, partial [Chloroflexota bacterium]